jgi:hypothetical protein
MENTRIYICGYIVSAGHTRYLLGEGGKALEVEAVDAATAFIIFTELVTLKGHKVSEFHTFHSVNANPKLYKDAHGWRGNIQYPRKEL